MHKDSFICAGFEIIASFYCHYSIMFGNWTSSCGAHSSGKLHFLKLNSVTISVDNRWLDGENFSSIKVVSVKIAAYSLLSVSSTVTRILFLS